MYFIEHLSLIEFIEWYSVGVLLCAFVLGLLDADDNIFTTLLRVFIWPISFSILAGMFIRSLRF